METTENNKHQWNNGAYQAWINRFGTPEEAAEKMKQDPRKRIGKALDYMGDVDGKKIANLLGSNGNKAAALALLGAEVAVVDFSIENERYALELAEAAHVRLRYILSDVLQMPAHELTGDYDIVYMEHGILHYFLDLKPLFAAVRGLLRPGGMLVLQDFHPITTKLISSRGTTANIRKHKVTGDYFDASIQETEVAYSKFLSDEGHERRSRLVQQRKWTLGEVITAIAGEGLFVKTLEELPNQSSEVFDKGIPKTFVVVAEKM